MTNKKTIIKARQKDWEKFKCPVCKSNNWTESKDVGMIQIPRIKPTDTIAVPNFENKPLMFMTCFRICSECGLVLWRAVQGKKEGVKVTENTNISENP